MPCRIINYGSLNVDHVYNTAHFTEPGETQSADTFQLFAGGKGLNQSIACARAGAQVTHAGAIGSDGRFLLDLLHECGINTDYLQERSAPGGHTVIEVNGSGQNRIILFKGTNFSQTRAEIDRALTSCAANDILLLQNEINELDYLIDSGASRGLRVILNASPVNEDLLSCDLGKCCLLAVNELEAAVLTNLSADLPGSELLEAMHCKYPHSIIVLTCGAQGAYTVTSDGKQLFQAAFKVKAVDTTAAGDTFLGYLAAGLALDLDLQSALQQASAAAALAVMSPGAAPSIPQQSAVRDFLSKTVS